MTRYDNPYGVSNPGLEIAYFKLEMTSSGALKCFGEGHVKDPEGSPMGHPFTWSINRDDVVEVRAQHLPIHNMVVGREAEPVILVRGRVREMARRILAPV